MTPPSSPDGDERPAPDSATVGWAADQPWSDESEADLETRVDATLAARWEVMKSYADTVAKAPSETIVPSRRLRTTAGERALAAVRMAEVPTERLEVADEVIGVGGMSVVRRGRQTALDREVAVKELPERDADAKHAALELLQEAWVTGRLEHPNVVPIYDLALDPQGRPRLVMKRIEGVRWTELMEDPEQVRQRFGATDTLAWHLGLFMQVCHAIHFAHERGVIHRDIKPDNVMIGAYGEVYVLDWGIAVTTGDSSVLPSHEAASMAGTPPYMAPEMISGERPTIRTDVYLLGGLLYELIAGKPPHHGTTLKEIARKVLLSQPSIPAHAPPELAAVIRKALSRNPADRYEDAEALRRAVQELLEQREARALTQAATVDLDRLEELVAEAYGKPEEDVRAEIYDVFGACRFGFRAALARYPEDREAREGLTRAVETMVELELARDNGRGAATLLGELDEPAAELVTRVERARAASKARQHELERIAYHHDLNVGVRPRWYVLWLLGLIWTGIPLWQMVRTDFGAPTWTHELVRPLVYCVIFLVILGFKYQELASNLLNRQLWGGAMTLFAIESLFTYGQYIAGMDPTMASIQDHALRAVGIGFLAIFIDRILWIGAVGFAATYLLAVRWPEARFIATSTANALMMGSLLWRWRPSRLEGEKAR